ncbi:hypothetical protein A7K93_09745 [Candidatus Methylacidiphilum fumarolicum]|nr:hypothetical protein A7K73_09655 [Candidatus Methylacidiphilum fumarolicum]TFE71478.1 hypothetical protein A7K72_10815 [Candidatus Methylacidiphilum fumarolicum]TFE71999.1 hypothetical protein A7K93_09745 [Candidatus Methylacidiphilum fumarolicum]TFE75066.1 hypothetical protein A7D33_11085 [Candidatus Methylacidiphilum fumarolicum]
MAEPAVAGDDSEGGDRLPVSPRDAHPESKVIQLQPFGNQKVRILAFFTFLRFRRDSGSWLYMLFRKVQIP